MRRDVSAFFPTRPYHLCLAFFFSTRPTPYHPFEFAMTKRSLQWPLRKKRAAGRLGRQRLAWLFNKFWKHARDRQKKLNRPLLTQWQNKTITSLTLGLVTKRWKVTSENNSITYSTNRSGCAKKSAYISNKDRLSRMNVGKTTYKEYQTVCQSNWQRYSGKYFSRSLVCSFPHSSMNSYFFLSF